MPITKDIFDGFVGNLVAVITAEIGGAYCSPVSYVTVGLILCSMVCSCATLADVPSLAQDLMPVGALLNSPAISIMCNQAGCPNKGKFMTKPCPTTVIGTTTTKDGGATTKGNTTVVVGGPTTTVSMKLSSSSISSLSFVALAVALAARFF